MNNDEGPTALCPCGTAVRQPAASRHLHTAVQCESQASPDLLEEDGLARPVVDVEELGSVLVGGSRASGQPRTRQPAGSGERIDPSHAQNSF